MADISEATGIPLDELKEKYFEHNHLSSVGNKLWGEMMMGVVESFGVSEEIKNKIPQLIETFRKNKKINEGLLDMLKALKKQNFKVAIFSNNTSGLREKLIRKGIIDLVDDAVISVEIGFQKPHEKAFDVLFRRLGVKPEEVVFIDDTPIVMI